MRKSKIFSIILTFLIIGIALGFTNTNSGNFNDKADKDPKSTFLSRSQTNSELNSNKNNLVFDKLSILQNLNDNNGIPATTFGSPYYTDNFDGANDTVSLKSRGYKVYFRGTGIQDPATPTWFQGNPAVFNSFNGPANGYVSSYYRTVTGINNIDNWLVLPKKNIASTDSIFFYQRSFFNSTYADSIRVMYSAAGDSTPESISWVELGRFRANFTTNNWVKVGFKAASAGANARYAIRYSVVNGGPSGVNSDVIGIDALSLELTQLTADVGVQSLNSPSGTIGIPSAAIIPNATIKNFGTATQTFNVTMTITPAGYSSTKTVTSLSGNATINVNFDSYTPAIGSYTVKVYTQLASDDNKNNDTTSNSISVIQPNYGGGGVGTGGYFFANSTANAVGSPSKPEYCRVDTTGSTSLVLNNIEKVTLTRGNLDDGHWALFNVGGLRKIKFMGVKYDSVFIGTNGIICFTNFIPDSGNFSPPANGLPGNGSGGVSRPGVYPLWNDMNWRNLAQPLNRLSYKIDNSKNLLIINYDRAPIYNGSAADFVTFQVVIGLQADTLNSPNSNIVFNYSNSSTNVSLPALTGIQNSDGTNYLQYYFKNLSSTVVTPGTIFDTVSSGVSVAFSPNQNNLNGSCRTLTLTALIQGFWNGTTNVRDTIKIQLRNSLSPYNIIETARGFSDNSGNVFLNFASAVNGTSYYLTVKHRNSLETWSKTGGAVFTGSAMSYNFTTSLIQSYGTNAMVLNGGKYCIWGGDVNQDDITDAGDINDVDNGVINGDTGYVLTDVNGDDFVDAADLSLVENNVVISPILQRP